MITETDLDSLPDWAKERVTLLQSIEMQKERVSRSEVTLGILRNRKKDNEGGICLLPGSGCRPGEAALATIQQRLDAAPRGSAV